MNECPKYNLHRTMARPITFKGLKGRYIIYAGISLVAAILLFVLLYLIGMPSLIDIALCSSLSASTVTLSYRLGKKFGEHGLEKWWANKQIPGSLRYTSRKTFVHATIHHEKDKNQ